MDPSKSMIGIIARKDPFTKIDCAKVIQILVDELRPHLRHVTLGCFGDFRMHGDQISDLIEESRKVSEMFDLRGYFWYHPQFIAKRGGVIITTVYGIDRDGHWHAAQIARGRSYTLVPGIEWSTTVETLVSRDGPFSEFSITYVDLAVDLFSVVEDVLKQKTEQYHSAILLDKTVGGLNPLVFHVLKNLEEA